MLLARCLDPDPLLVSSLGLLSAVRLQASNVWYTSTNSLKLRLLIYYFLIAVAKIKSPVCVCVITSTQADARRYCSGGDCHTAVNGRKTAISLRQPAGTIRAAMITTVEWPRGCQSARPIAVRPVEYDLIWQMSLADERNLSSSSAHRRRMSEASAHPRGSPEGGLVKIEKSKSDEVVRCVVQVVWRWLLFISLLVERESVCSFGIVRVARIPLVNTIGWCDFSHRERESAMRVHLSFKSELNEVSLIKRSSDNCCRTWEEEEEEIQADLFEMKYLRWCSSFLFFSFHGPHLTHQVTKNSTWSSFRWQASCWRGKRTNKGGLVVVEKVKRSSKIAYSRLMASAINQGGNRLIKLSAN